MKFLFKAITIYFRAKKQFNCKNNYRYSKLADFKLDNISKINCKILIIILYILLRLRSKKV